MADYSYIDSSKFRPTRFTDWGYQLGTGSETIIYYPTGEIWELGKITGWHNNSSFDIVIFLRADISVAAEDLVTDYMYGASTSSVDEAIEYLGEKLGYRLNEREEQL